MNKTFILWHTNATLKREASKICANIGIKLCIVAKAFMAKVRESNLQAIKKLLLDWIQFIIQPHVIGVQRTSIFNIIVRAFVKMYFRYNLLLFQKARKQFESNQKSPLPSPINRTIQNACDCFC